jgi:hypothetical protein
LPRSYVRVIFHFSNMRISRWITLGVSVAVAVLVLAMLPRSRSLRLPGLRATNFGCWPIRHTIMSDTPPIISPPVAPPPPPVIASEQGLQTYLTRCEVLCIVAASLFLIGVAGFILRYVEEGKANWGALGFGIWYALMGYGAAWLLHRRRSEAYLATVPCLLIMLLVIPVGTVFGIFGWIWLNKGKALLTRG